MDNENENSGIVEPYELSITDTDTNVDIIVVDEDPDAVQADLSSSSPSSEPTPISSPSEIDLSGYQYDIVPTYKMIEDPDDQDTLFRIQFLQAFGITNDEYHPEIVSAVINDLYERYHTHPTIREILELHPLYHSGVVESIDVRVEDNDNNDATDADDDDETPPLSPSPRNRTHRIVPKENNSEMIFCMMFSFHLFDLFHTCLRHAKYKEEIPTSLRDGIVDYLRNTF